MSADNFLPSDGEVFYFPAFFSASESDALFAALQTEIAWKQEPIVIFGKRVLQPRLTAWLGEADYRYSGITMIAHPWNTLVRQIKTKIEATARVSFTGALLNYYRDQSDSMGWHRDDEKELGTNPVIGSVSFGAAREMQFRHIDDKSLKRSVLLEHGSFLLMRGATQHHWQHAIPKRARAIGPRINLTFRVVGAVANLAHR